MPEPSRPLMSFPCEFAIKVIGIWREDFQARVLDILGRHVPDLENAHVSNRTSSAGKYLSVTVAFRARSREQLDAIYRELTADDRVTLVL